MSKRIVEEGWDESYQIIDITEFNDFCKNKLFKVGPFISRFGDGEGEPYVPNKMVWGILKGGRKVRAIRTTG